MYCKEYFTNKDIKLNDKSHKTMENDANEFFRTRKNTQKLIKDGDIFRFKKFNYRNDGVFIYYNKKLNNLDFSIDDYGHVPKYFNFLDYNPRYWSKSIVHNSLVYGDLSKIDVKFYSKDLNKKEDFYVYYYTFVNKNEKYGLLAISTINIFQEKEIQKFFKKNTAYDYDRNEDDPDLDSFIDFKQKNQLKMKNIIYLYLDYKN